MALVLTSPLDVLYLLLDHADLKIDRIHLNARDEFLLWRAFSLGRHRNFWISALLIENPCRGEMPYVSLLREKAVDRKAMRRRLALPTPKPFASRKPFPHTGGQAVQDAVDAF